MSNEKAPYVILYEDSDIVVVYKKRDVFSIRTNDKKTFSHNLYHYLHDYLAKKNESLFVVHRLDYETSGVMVFAKKLEVKKSLQNLFEERKVGRFYEAVVKESVPFGQRYDVVQYLNDDGKQTKVAEKENGKEAVTHLVAKNPIQIGTALSITIETGRHNQIRMALQHLKLTLIGDKRYGANVAKRMYLNEYKLEFPAESNLKQLSFSTSPLWIKSDCLD